MVNSNLNFISSFQTTNILANNSEIVKPSLPDSKRNKISQKTKNAMRDHYIKILSNLLTEEKNKRIYLFNKDRTSTGITATTLMKVIKIALCQQAFHLIYIERKDLRYPFIANIETNNLQLFQIRNRLAKGYSSEIYEACALHLGKLRVLKVARRSQKLSIERREQARIDIEREYKILYKIHEKGCVWGIQAKPTMLVHFTLFSNEIICGYIGKYYQSDYFDLVTKRRKENKPIPLEQALMDIYQILLGLDHVASLGIVHGDIKPENILVKDKNEYRYVVLADWGGARDVADEHAEWEELGVTTKDYLSLNDIEEFLRLQMLYEQEAQPSKQAEIRQEIIELHKKRDVFAMGLTLYFILSHGESPYPLQEIQLEAYESPMALPDVKAVYKDLAVHVPLEIKNLIKAMLNCSYKNRPTAEAVFKQFDQFVRNNYQILPSF